MSDDSVELTKLLPADLIVNLYGSRKNHTEFSQPIKERMIQHFDMQLDSQPETWYAGTDEQPTAFLNIYYPPEANDSLVIQIALNATEDTLDTNEQQEQVVTAWANLRNQLETILDQSLLEKDSLWGYTLIYHAILNQNRVYEPDRDIYRVFQCSIDKVSKEAKRLHQEKPAESYPVSANVSGGKLWLVDFPILDKSNPHAATVYIAIGTSIEENEEHLEPKVLWGRTSSLFIPELIAHKSYWLWRDYHKLDTKRNLTARRGYENYIETLRKQTSDLLRNKGNLNEFSDSYDAVLDIVLLLEKPYDTIERQEHNYIWWKNKEYLGEITEFHCQYIESIKKDLELLIRQGRNILADAQIAINIIRARSSETIEEQQRSIQGLVATAGLLLASVEAFGNYISTRSLSLAFLILFIIGFAAFFAYHISQQYFPKNYKNILLICFVTVASIISIFVFFTYWLSPHIQSIIIDL